MCLWFKKDESTDAELDVEASAANMDTLQGAASLNIDVDRKIEYGSKYSDSETDNPQVTSSLCYEWHKVGMNFMSPNDDIFQGSNGIIHSDCTDLLNK